MHVRTYSVNKRHLSPGIALHFAFYARSARFMSRFMFRTECADRPEYGSWMYSYLRNTEAVVRFYPPFPYFSPLSLITPGHLVRWRSASFLSTSFAADGDFTSHPANCRIFPDPRVLRHVKYRIHYRNYFGVVSYSACPYSDARSAREFFRFFFFLLFLAFNGNTFRCLCRGKNEEPGVDKATVRTVFWADRLSAPMNHSFFNISFWSIEIIPHGFGPLSQKHATFVIGWCTIRRPVVSLAGRASKTIVCPTLNEVDYLPYSIAKEDPRQATHNAVLFSRNTRTLTSSQKIIGKFLLRYIVYRER